MKKKCWGSSREVWSWAVVWALANIYQILLLTRQDTQGRERKEEEILWRATEGGGAWRKGSSGITFSLHNYLKGGCSQVGLGLLSQATSSRKRAHSLKLCKGRFRLDIRKKFSQKRRLKIGMDCSRWWWNHCPLRCLWRLVLALGAVVQLTWQCSKVELDDLRDLETLNKSGILIKLYNNV